jgi:DNA-binding MarR family transcriptional regulator
MKKILQSLNKVFDNRIRLGIMSLLMVNESIEFNAMKDLLGITDGNLASHITGLEKNGYLQVKKSFVGKKPNTRYSVTKAGIKAFNEHLNALESLIRTST